MADLSLGNGVLDGASLADLSIDGMVNVVALRNTSFKNQRCGIFSIRLKELASVAIANALKPDCAVTMGFGGDLYTHQIIVLFNVVPCPPSPAWFYIVGPERGG